MSGEEDAADFAGGVEDQHVPGGRVGPPPAQRGVQGQARQHGGGQDPVDQRDPALGPQDGLPSARPVRALPAASANITTAVIAV